MAKITTIIYETKGRAREYCELAANLYRGCGHGCTYCYAPSATFRKREDFCNATVRDDVLKKFRKDVLELEKAGETRPILLSFTTDPYQPLDAEEELTRKAIRLLHKHGLKVEILTKGGKLSERDFDLLSANPELSSYGSTLVFTDETMRKEIEPNAAPTNERIESLKKAHEMGIRTFVSLEPVWDPVQTLEIIDLTHEFVDLFKVGKLNYNKQHKNVDWVQFKEDVVQKLEEYGNKYYLKQSLQDV
ncbi:radical SAM protein [Methanococcoides methylutens]|uniref:Radical SAM domain protein n=1 Tax=Methanococcoides methylutens MM1 TaxID=1434104 RepID=A0A0E3X035_METMT|nr:radical SAM protein [Methanococcoides methylutens]AKB85405.1 Radical SAM domain protein [Methanococcoides methylutens MM1]